MRHRSTAFRALPAAVASILVLAACQSAAPLTQPSWPAPADPIGIDLEADGVSHEVSDDGTAHEYFVNATCDAPCLSPLHTHDPTGLIHTESKVADQEPYTLGQFFTEWDVRLDGDCVGAFCMADAPIAVYLDGDTYEGDPAEIELTSHLEIAIAIVIGTAPSTIPDSYPFLDPA